GGGLCKAARRAGAASPPGPRCRAGAHPSTPGWGGGSGPPAPSPRPSRLRPRPRNRASHSRPLAPRRERSPGRRRSRRAHPCFTSLGSEPQMPKGACTMSIGGASPILCPMPIRVVLADDSFIVREGIRELLESVDEVDVVATCSDMESLRVAIEKERPDVVLTDIRM